MIPYKTKSRKISGSSYEKEKESILCHVFHLNKIQIK